MDRPRYQLCWADNAIDVVDGIVIGRGLDCSVVLDDPCISRRHASVEVHNGLLYVEDLGSRNGVLVNGVRIDARRRLLRGDLLLVGSAQFRVIDIAPDPKLVETARSADKSQQPTQRFDALGPVGQLAEKAIALGRMDEAERLLSSVLMQILHDARSGRTPNALVLERSAELVVELLAVTHHGGWLDWLVVVFSATGKPWSAAVVERLYAIGTVLEGYNYQVLHDYCDRLREMRLKLGPAERFQVGRIEGLVQLLSAS